jgi:hypothetical protein
MRTPIISLNVEDAKIKEKGRTVSGSDEWAGERGTRQIGEAHT